MKSLMVPLLLCLLGGSYTASAATSSRCPGEEGYYFTNDRETNPRRGGFVGYGAYVSEDAFIAPTAAVCESASVEDQARIMGKAIVRGEAIIGGNARISGNAIVAGSAEINTRDGSTVVSGNAHITEGRFTEGRYKQDMRPRAMIQAEREAAQAAEAERRLAADQARRQAEAKARKQAIRDAVKGFEKAIAGASFKSHFYGDVMRCSRQPDFSSPYRNNAYYCATKVFSRSGNCSFGVKTQCAHNDYFNMNNCKPVRDEWQYEEPSSRTLHFPLNISTRETSIDRYSAEYKRVFVEMTLRDKDHDRIALLTHTRGDARRIEKAVAALNEVCQ